MWDLGRLGNGTAARTICVDRSRLPAGRILISVRPPGNHEAVDWEGKGPMGLPCVEWGGHRLFREIR